MVAPPKLPMHQWRILRALLACRTPALGGHRYRSEDCGQSHFVPHSCRNRHCPLCQSQAAHRWLEQQQAALLPVPYFHQVFTLPHDSNPLIRQNQHALALCLGCGQTPTASPTGPLGDLSVPQPNRRGASRQPFRQTSRPVPCFGDKLPPPTFPYNPGLVDSAVQFNSGVSPMPAMTPKAISQLVGGRHGGYPASGYA